ncbi:TKL family protein kinase [Trichomonas vaginalis G3]|uniref:TKL family protein kinase n=1 Tax=Trichomonas vaginalis (strain ATCC PRA-98 / G3) TaxID=412133 RepID=A2E1W1_TRIV3|nr:protein kinase protein [Trichomonas vaginalis G3]EAY13310.1 TKL family protein kinase [Trichomonas vaginalis G3]KAI5540423.1 protein kinase protein [Trichomonas vaginalis G3]|eukprot:XP_001325533.1 TKL family protein kinase [Trichomonas vaginalis G3]
MPVGNDTITTLPAWLQNIRSEAYSILTQYKNIVIHRAKLALLCSELLAFHKSQINVPNRQVTPGENTNLQLLSKLITDMRNVFISFSEQNFLQVLIKANPCKFINQLNEFRVQFNKCCIELNFTKNEPCPINPIQTRIDDASDMAGIIEMIDLALETQANRFTAEQKQVFELRKQECIEAVEKYNEIEAASKEQKDQLLRNMTAEEVTENLKEFKEWNINPDDFELQKRLGSGTFADVYLGYQKSTGLLVGFKKLKTQQFKFHDFQMYKREIQIFSSLKHYAILPFVGASIQHPYCLVTEFMSNGNLFERLRKATTPFDGTRKTICALGIAEGMAYMHSKNIMHRDLKSLNILLDSDDFPKICDFGMSRNIEGADVLTGGIGTYRWMAPEVLDSRPYTFKADVYSYAIVLWELLTQDVPFHGLSEIQVSMNVIQKDARPLFPQNCPQKIVKLIKRCWDRDPDQRPDFETIAKMFKCGLISFPGTNQDQVNAYISQFSSHESNLGEFDINKVTEKSIDQIIMEMEGEQTISTALAKLKLIDDKNNWQNLLRNSEVIRAIVDQMKSCSLAQTSFDLVQCFYPLSCDSVMCQSFVKLGGTQALLELILKFGSANMPKAIESLTNVMAIDNNVKLTAEHFAKLASFLGTTELSIRISSTDLLSLVVRRRAFETDTAVISIINSVLGNAIREAKLELLKATLKLIKLLLPYQKAINFLARGEGPTTILDILQHDDEEVLCDTLDIMRALIGEIQQPQKAIQSYSSLFVKVVSHGSIQLMTKALYVVGVIVHSPFAFKLFNDSEPGFQQCLKQNNTTIAAYSLQLMFALLSNQSSFQAFSGLGEYIVPHLNSDKPGIAALAASCLTVIIMNLQDKVQGKVFVETLANFVKTALNNDILRQPALRLTGVVSMSFAGAKFLDNSGCIPLLQSCLSNSDCETRKLAFMAFAAFTQSYPLSANANNAVDDFVKALDDDKVAPYPLICIRCITSDPCGALHCVQHINRITKLFENDDDETLETTFSTVENIVSDPSSAGTLDTNHDIKCVVQAMSKFTSIPAFRERALAILDEASKFHYGRAALRKYQIVDFCKEQINNSSVPSTLKKYYVRIISRTKASDSADSKKS